MMKNRGLYQNHKSYPFFQRYREVDKDTLVYPIGKSNQSIKITNEPNIEKVEKPESQPLEAIGLKVKSEPTSSVARAAEEQIPHENIPFIKPLPHYDSLELRELAAIISRDIFQENPNVRWSDIAGLQTSKRLIKEAIVFPIKYPE
jgi:katanin p60 ATPase-containing subunit A1